MKPLLEPDDADAPSFDLVVVSLPGYCWSQGPPRGWTLQDTARIYDVLMKRLGYQQYAAQAGDWGHWVVRELGSGRYDACKAVHTNMCPGMPPKDYKPSEKEQVGMDRAQWFMGKPLHESHMGYAIEMRTRPQTIGVAFNDNPVGIMMFVGEKYQELADPDLGTATLENRQWLDDLCTTLCLYFFTPPSVMTSMLCYYNNVRHEEYTEFNAKEENLIRVPFGVSHFAYDAFPAPKAGVETTTTNLKFFRGELGGLMMMLEEVLMVGQRGIMVVTLRVWSVRGRWWRICESSLENITVAEA
jgi:pimeloyl-ACP methyl ester carboxylesterase